jgi:hypothetical protein
MLTTRGGEYPTYYRTERGNNYVGAKVSPFRKLLPLDRLKGLGEVVSFHGGPGRVKAPTRPRGVGALTPPGRDRGLVVAVRAVTA